MSLPCSTLCELPWLREYSRTPNHSLKANFTTFHKDDGFTNAMKRFTL